MKDENVLEEKPIPIVFVKKILEKRAKEGELTYEQKITLDYAKEMYKEKKKDVEEAMKALKDLGLEEKLAVKIVDIKPKDANELKLIFEKTRFDLQKDVQEKILDIVAKLR